MPEVILIGQFPLAIGVITAVLGGLSAYWVAAWLARRHGGDGEAAQDVVLNLALGGVIGAKLLYVALDPLGHLANPLTLILFPYGPAALPAGVVGGLTLAAWGLRRRGDRLSVLDSAVPGASLGLAVAAVGLRGAGLWAFAPLLLVAAAVGLGPARSPVPGLTAARSVTLTAAALVLGDLARPTTGLSAGVSLLQLAAAVVGSAAWLWSRRLETTK